ncbi:MAG: DUF4870 domain-containing protein [Phycisphaeraceae bacterium]|nr:DUF4870 domain-containing protein [Phycisphaeraceae bacterium]MBX3405478.1 DUF4870 domain-containing protein [Phycisphaeraceae bacterium]
MGGQAYANAWMNEQPGQPVRGERLVDPAATSDQRTYALIMHLSLIASHFLPLALVIAPLVMWLIKKDESAFLDDHGKEATNFQLSLLLYALLIGALSIISCGIAAVAFIPLYVLAIVGMVLGAAAANRGEYFRYPACLRLIG